MSSLNFDPKNVLKKKWISIIVPQQKEYFQEHALRSCTSRFNIKKGDIKSQFWFQNVLKKEREKNFNNQSQW